jgi:hypothetical protein
METLKRAMFGADEAKQETIEEKEEVTAPPAPRVVILTAKQQEELDFKREQAAEKVIVEAGADALFENIDEVMLCFVYAKQC